MSCHKWISSDSRNNKLSCARLVDNQEAVFKSLQDLTSKFGDSGAAKQARHYIDSIYKSKEDIPIMIAPTEDGWLTVNLNRKITTEAYRRQRHEHISLKYVIIGYSRYHYVKEISNLDNDKIRENV